VAAISASVGASKSSTKRSWSPEVNSNVPIGSSSQRSVARARRSASGRSTKCRRKRPPACSATARTAQRSAAVQQPKSRTTEPPTPSTSCAAHNKRPSTTSRLPTASGSRHVVPKSGIIHSSGVNRTALSSCAIFRARVVLPTPGRPTVKCSVGVTVMRASLTPSPTKDTHVGMRERPGMSPERELLERRSEPLLIHLAQELRRDRETSLIPDDTDDSTPGAERRLFLLIRLIDPVPDFRWGIDRATVEAST
jgi:hypothetical protein